MSLSLSFHGRSFSGAVANQNSKVSLESNQTEQLHLKGCGCRDKILCHSKKSLALVSCGQLSLEVEIGGGMNTEGQCVQPEGGRHSL